MKRHSVISVTVLVAFLGVPIPATAPSAQGLHPIRSQGCGSPRRATVQTCAVGC